MPEQASPFPPSACAIGVDLGGQSVKLGLVDHQGRVSLRRRSPIDATQSLETITGLILNQIRELVREARESGHSPAGIGMVMPGYMNPERTQLTFAANLPTLSGTDFLARLREGVELPIQFDADSNAAAYCEYCFGAGRGVDRLITVAIGTGVGGGVIVNGRVLRVWNHIAGSLGHVIIDPNGPRCACGARGCIEVKASGRALETRARELAVANPMSRLASVAGRNGGRLSAEDVGNALHAGDATARQAVKECGWWLGAGIAAWSAVYAPSKVLIGGGVAAIGEPLLEAIRAGLREVGQPYLTRDIQIERAAFGPDAGLVGAAALAMTPQTA